MTNSIPASNIVSVIPGVLGAGGNPLSLNAVFLTQDVAVPIGVAMPFESAADVSAFFGPSAPETHLANIYFAGFIGATKLPGTLYFTQFNTAIVGAYLRSASLAGMTLTQLQAISGFLNVTIDGVAQISASINLSGATSFSNAATLITAGMVAGTSFDGTGSLAGNTLTVTVAASGALHVGSIITGAGVTPATITAILTGTGGVGTYSYDGSTQTVSSEEIKVLGVGSCTYDSVRQAFIVHSPTTGASSTIGFGSGTISPLLKLTSATGAVTSQGAIANTPAGVMAQVVNATQNWATFMTVTEVIDSVKLQFAAWVQTTNQRYAYVVQDSNAAALTANATGSFGNIVDAASDNGIVTIYDTTGGDLAAFFCGATASIDFTATAGRITYDFKGQAGIVPQITDATVAANLTGNGYNFYAQYATAAQPFQFFQPGQISGRWEWADAYINQIYLNSQFQLALMELLTTVKSLPYNTKGYGQIRGALADPITQALAFGSIQSGVALSASQAASVNTAAGVQISDTLQNVGYYLQIVPASPQARAARTSPPMTFWYTDGGSIQALNLASIDIQ